MLQAAGPVFGAVRTDSGMPESHSYLDQGGRRHRVLVCRHNPQQQLHTQRIATIGPSSIAVAATTADATLRNLDPSPANLDPSSATLLCCAVYV
jgi:hypothetical protein